MVKGWTPRLEVRRLLEAVEAAAPMDAVDEVAAQLARLFRARRVAFLIADLSGRAVVRLTRDRDGGAGTDGDDAEKIPFAAPSTTTCCRRRSPRSRRTTGSRRDSTGGARSDPP